MGPHLGQVWAAGGTTELLPYKEGSRAGDGRGGKASGAEGAAGKDVRLEEELGEGMGCGCWHRVRA